MKSWLYVLSLTMQSKVHSLSLIPLQSFLWSLHYIAVISSVRQGIGLNAKIFIQTTIFC
jgi:hypothetical protein